jgi:hypothetical protein
MTENPNFPISDWQAAVKGGELMGYAEWAKHQQDDENADDNGPELRSFSVTIGADLRGYVTIDNVLAIDAAAARADVLERLEAEVAWAASGYSWKLEDIKGDISIAAIDDNSESDSDEQCEFVPVPDWNGPDYGTLEQFTLMIAALSTPEDIATRDNIAMDEVEKRITDEFLHGEYEALLSIVHKARKLMGIAAAVSSAVQVDQSEISPSGAIANARDALREALCRTDWLDPVHFRNAIADVVNDLDGFMKLASTADNAPAI